MTSERVEEAVGQFLRISRMSEAGDLTNGQVVRGFRALRATLRPEEWTAVQYEACARRLEAAGWRVER